MRQEKTEALFLRPTEAARLLNLSMATMYEMLHDNSIPRVKLAGRAWRIPRVAIDKLIEEAMASSVERGLEPR